MKALSFLAVILALGLSFGATDAEAKRMGGGKSFGMRAGPRTGMCAIRSWKLDSTQVDGASMRTIAPLFIA
mgnify:CR=1 FL=1